MEYAPGHAILMPRTSTQIYHSKRQVPGHFQMTMMMVPMVTTITTLLSGPTGVIATIWTTSIVALLTVRFANGAGLPTRLTLTHGQTILKELADVRWKTIMTEMMVVIASLIGATVRCATL